MNKQNKTFLIKGFIIYIYIYSWFLNRKTVTTTEKIATKAQHSTLYDLYRAFTSLPR